MLGGDDSKGCRSSGVCSFIHGLQPWLSHVDQLDILTVILHHRAHTHIDSGWGGVRVVLMVRRVGCVWEEPALGAVLCGYVVAARENAATALTVWRGLPQNEQGWPCWFHHGGAKVCKQWCTSNARGFTKPIRCWGVVVAPPCIY